MRVLIINHFPLVGSGSGVYVSDIAKSLTSKGHEVCIIMPENTTRFSKITKVKIHPVYFKRNEKIDKQLDFNFPCMDPHPRSSFLFHNMNDIQIKQYENAFRMAIEEEIEHFKPDVIHSQHIWIISGLLNDYNIPYIITSHGADHSGCKGHCINEVNTSMDHAIRIIGIIYKKMHIISFTKRTISTNEATLAAICFYIFNFFIILIIN